VPHVSLLSAQVPGFLRDALGIFVRIDLAGREFANSEYVRKPARVMIPWVPGEDVNWPAPAVTSEPEPMVLRRMPPGLLGRIWLRVGYYFGWL
jgi:hypothetical protein